MKLKRILAVALALVMVFTLTACGGGGSEETTTSASVEETTGGEQETQGGGSTELAGTYNVTVWAPEAAVDLVKGEIDAYNSSNTDGIVISATVEPVSEADAATNMITDVAAGADLFFFAQDQLARLIQAGSVSKLGDNAASIVKNEHNSAAIVAATSGTDLYAYPISADNGYMMYYDKSVVPDSDVDSLEKIIEDCEAANKNISYELENAWYAAGMFFATGCHSDWITDNDGNFQSIDDDFNSDKGLIAAKGIYKVVSSPKYVNSSNADFANGSAVVVTGTWNYQAILEQLGDNFGVTDLPSFTVDGQEYHIGSYSGCKLLGVKPQEDAVKGAALQRLAQYLTGKDAQLDRFNNLGWGPSNKEALQDPAVQADPTLAALNLQNEYAVNQPNIHGSWWDIAKVIATDIKASDGSDDALKACLEKYENSVNAVFEMSEDVRNAFTVIGSINGDEWTVDLPMTADGDIWTSNDAFQMEAGTEFKVRQGKAWDTAYPAENFRVETAGTYKVQLNAATGEVTLVPAE